MKILHVAETIQGGVASVLDQLVLDQVNNSYSVKVLIPLDQQEYLTDKDSIISYRKTGRNIFSFIILAFSFLKTILLYKPDIIHLHSSFAGAICRAVLFLIPFRKAKVIYCPHSFAFMMNVSKRKKKLYASIERILSLVTDRIVCVGSAEYSVATKFGINAKKLQVIYNGVPSLQKIDLSQKLYLRNNVINFLFVGRFDYQKGFDLLIKLFEHTQNLKVHFTVIGDFVHANKNQKPQFSHVTYVGWMPKAELVTYYKDADVLIMPSRWEGLPMVALEAFSMGVPLFASNCESLSEIVVDNEDGFLFENNSAESLNTRFDEIYNVLDKQMLIQLSQLVQVKFEQNFTAQKMLDETLNLYRELI